jgi:hypothetical protein
VKFTRAIGFLCAALATISASVASASVPLVEGDLVAIDYSLLRRVTEQPVSSADAISGTAVSFVSNEDYQVTYNPGLFGLGADGDAIVFDGTRDALVRIDVDSGAWQVFSGPGVGSGPALRDSSSLVVDPVVEPSGSILLIQPGDGAPAIVRIDPETGDRAVFLQAPVAPTEPGEFPEFDPRALAVRPDGTIVLYSYHRNGTISQARLFDVDPVTAARTPIAFLDPEVGAWPAIAGYARLDLASTGEALFFLDGDLIGVSPLGAVRTISGNGVGSGPALAFPYAFAASGAGPIYVTQPGVNYGDDEVLAIDPLTGNRTLLPNPVPPPLDEPRRAISSLAVAPDGNLLGVPSASPSRLIGIDTATGLRSIAFSSAVGSGASTSLGSAPARIDGQRRFSSAVHTRIHLVDGERELIPIGSGPPWYPIRSFDFAEHGEIYAIDASGGNCGQILRIDGVTGDRTIVSENGIEPPYWVCPRSIVVGDYDEIERLDPATGVHEVISDETHGEGPLWYEVGPMQVGPDGSLIMLVNAEHVFYRIDPATGDRSIYFDASNGAGPAPPIGSFVVEPDGKLAYIEWSPFATGATFANRIVRVDPANGDPVEIAQGYFQALAQVPEPTAGLLALVAAATLAWKAERRGR